MIRDFEKASRLGHLLSKDFAGRILALLTKYRDISASEAASRIGLHVRTAQEFLEGLAEAGIVERREVYEKKRPYYRFSLSERKIEISIDLDSAFSPGKEQEAGLRYREKKDSRARFTTARGGGAISSVTIWSGEGRDREERRISLTGPQGSFLFHLPFPGADPMSVEEIMARAGLPGDVIPEVLDIVGLLEGYGILETAP